jgi:hypothetical protein
MADAIDDLVRLAMLDEWEAKCVWCRRPLFFNQMEVEHLIPKSLGEKGNGEDTAETLQLHGLDADYDVHALENLAPSCRPCNGGKGAKPPPDAPVITLLLERARDKAPGIRDTAEKMRGDRRIERAATILRAGADAGNPKAVEALREAARSLNVAFEEVTGRKVAHLHTAIEQLVDVGGLLAQSDAHFDYLPTAGRTGGPIHDIPEDSVMSYSEVGGTVTSRIDVVPRHPEALERYGPQVTFSPAEGEAGQRAVTLLNDALRVGRSVEITEGLDVTFERMPPFFASQTGRRVSGGTVRLTPLGDDRPRRPIPEWGAQIRMTSGSDSASLRVRLRQTETVPDGWDDALVGQRAGVGVTALFRWTDRSGQIRFNFKHLPDKSPVREQLAGMRFLEMLSRGGEMVITDQGKAKRPPLRMERAPSEVPPDAQALLVFLNDLSIIEERTGAKFTLPDEISAEEVRHVAEVAALVRNGERSVTWHDANLTVLEPAVKNLRDGGVMRMEETASAVVLGLEVQLGVLRRDLPAYEVVDVTPLDDQEGTFHVEIRPPNPAVAKIKEVLLRQDRGRRGPPPAPPRNAAQQRKKNRSARKRTKKGRQR